MFPLGLEPRTFRVLGGCDNHYTTETVEKRVSLIGCQNVTLVSIPGVQEQKNGTPKQIFIREYQQ